MKLNIEHPSTRRGTSKIPVSVSTFLVSLNHKVPKLDTHKSPFNLVGVKH